jgi:hypothetical protein
LLLFFLLFADHLHGFGKDYEFIIECQEHGAVISVGVDGIVVDEGGAQPSG